MRPIAARAWAFVAWATLLTAVSCHVDAALVFASQDSLGVGRVSQGQASAAAPPGDASAGARPFQVDLIGDAHVSRFNFTDLRHPYNALDGFAVLRVTAWLDPSKRVGLFGDVIPVVTGADEFFFQRYVQAGVGVQLYPIGVPPEGQPEVAGSPARRLLRPLRLFAQLSGRTYYDLPSDSELKRSDVQFGLDYYLDNLFGPSRLKAFAFTVAAYHTTNFSLESYNGLVWSGNVKSGPSVDLGPGSRLIPYAFVDWTWAPGHRERFFENFIHGGAGVRWYPASAGSRAAGSVVRRLHLYGEVVRNIDWLGEPAPSSVEQHDFRAGIAFATGGIYRDRR